MPTFLQRLQSASGAFAARKGPNPGPPGGSSLGSSWIGGPSTTDAWGAKRAPSPTELVESFKSIAYSCAVRNADAVAAVPLRLYMDSSRIEPRINGARPKSFNEPRDVSPRNFALLRSTGAIAGSGTKVADVKELRNHRFLNTLDNPDPNGDFDRVKLLKLISLYSDIVGQAYFYPEADEFGVFTTIWPLFSQYVMPIRRSSSPVVDYYQYFAETIDRSRIIRFGYGNSLKDPYGADFSALYAAIEYARLEDKFVTVQEQLLAQGPRPSMLASPKNADSYPGEAEKNRFEQDLMRKHARSAQGSVIVTTGAWDIRPLSYSPTDLSGLKIAEYDWQAICGAFGVPYVFFTTDTNLANLQAAKEQHADQGVRPRCTMIASKLTQIVRQWDRRLFFAFDDPYQLDAETKARIVDMAVKNGTKTINQANEETGIAPVSWGDEPWMQNTMAQPSAIEKLHEATIAASKLAASGSNEGGGTAAVGNTDAKKPKGGKRGGDGRNDRSGGGSDSGVGRGVRDQADATVHAIEGLDAEDEDRDPFDWLRWSVDPHSAGSD